MPTTTPAAPATPAIPSPAIPVSTVRCVIPRVVDMTAANAASKLRAAHCKVGTVTLRYSLLHKKGKVVSQNRARGRVLAAGTKVDIVVSRGVR
jgi:beta-lactam-binding protein with PASTA domain